MSGSKGALLALAAALALACGKSSSGAPASGGVQSNSDGGVVPGDGGADAGPGDGGASDGGAPDAGSPDAGAPDAGTPDGGGDGGATDGGVTLTPAPTLDGWTVYGPAQGLSQDVHDASTDEAGNVYVAGYDSLYVKRPDEPYFHRVDPDTAGLTKNCSTTLDPVNPLNCPNSIPTSQADTLCPVVSVAGGAAGVAAVGLQGRGTDGDNDLEWCLNSGGVDLVAFDGANVTRTRHVLIASPPGTVCETRGYGPGTPNPCPTWDFTWTQGRRKLRQVYRVVVNHLKGTPQYGDVWMGGTHATFSVLLANASARGWHDPANQWPDSVGVWEHDHPAVASNSGLFLTGEAWAIALDPTTGDPWASNGYRTASKQGYGAMPSGGWWQPMWPAYNATNQQLSYWDVWPDGTLDAVDPAAMDATSAMCFFADGTLWQGSSIHGLAKRAPDGTVTYLDLPAGLGDSVGGIGCDDSDGSLWVGFAWGGVGRLKNGVWSGAPQGLPASVAQPVRSVQIDRWSKPRVVWFSHLATRDKTTGKVTPGGLTSYSGP